MRPALFDYIRTREEFLNCKHGLFHPIQLLVAGKVLELYREGKVKEQFKMSFPF